MAVRVGAGRGFAFVEVFSALLALLPAVVFPAGARFVLDAFTLGLPATTFLPTFPVAFLRVVFEVFLSAT
ncbi:MAG: hypothetical protein KKB50_08660 [Planctomycetes bacterium]|nr:hypothetical protein [Planctomycetota bacterium]